MYVINEIDEQIDIVERAMGRCSGVSGRPGTSGGEFMHAHTMALDSRGTFMWESVMAAGWQKFKVMGGR